MEFFTTLSKINSIDSALSQLYSIKPPTTKVTQAVEDAQKFHDGQLRRSGIPYVIHPICVACIVAYYGGDESMICASLLHDVVEDTLCEIGYVYEKYGESVGKLVDALTKIVQIRDGELPSATSNEKLAAQALSFRKILLASVDDARVLIIKISDRMHNMLTLDALSTKKQMRIAEETLVVYAPIAHRLGISSLKNELEDKSFYYYYSGEYNKIQNYINNESQNLRLKLNHFKNKIETFLLGNGFLRNSFEIHGRLKRPYSIYLKMQRKGIGIDEMLDLLATRVIVKTPLDCYRALGIIHLNFKPIPSRLKDYIAIPKENAYQTIHTTVFDDGAIFEVQIRTFDMHKIAEFGVAAHWKYKSGGIAPNTEWLKNMQYGDNSIEEFYELVKNDLYNEDIIVFSPNGKTFNLPFGSVVLDFAYAVHSELGNKAKMAYVNHQPVSLLQKLKSGDIVHIVTSEQVQTRCTWIDSVKTSKAKAHMRTICNNKIKEIDRKVAFNILSTIFEKEHVMFYEFVKNNNLDGHIYRAATDLVFLKDIKNRIKKEYNIDNNFFAMLRFKTIKLSPLQFDNLLIYTNRNINEALFDSCCHPKYGDSIVAIKKGQKAIIHHKLCESANQEINNGDNQLFIKWTKSVKYLFRIIAKLEDKRGTMATFLSAIAKYQYNVISISYDRHKNTFSPLCELIVESDSRDGKFLYDVIKKKFNIVEISSLKDAYQGS